MSCSSFVNRPLHMHIRAYTEHYIPVEIKPSVYFNNIPLLDNEHNSPYNQPDISRLKRSPNTSQKLSACTPSVKYFARWVEILRVLFSIRAPASSSIHRCTRKRQKIVSNVERFRHSSLAFDSARRGLPDKPDVHGFPMASRDRGSTSGTLDATYAMDS